MLYSIIAAVSITCAIIAFYIYKRFNKKGSLSSDNNSVMTADVYYFYTSWCPYCVKARPEWEKFKTYWKDKKKDNCTLLFSEIDCDKNESLASKYDVDTYPCIKLIKDEKIYDYDAKPTLENLNKFLNMCFE
jgi:thiol-disulfide isomerase/thioredoxin